MALNGLLDIELAVKNPQELKDFWLKNGLIADASGSLGTADRKKQISIVEDTYRHLSAMHLSCENESDLALISRNLTDMGVSSAIQGTTLTCIDPIFGHQILIEVGKPTPLTAPPVRTLNGPGNAVRVGERADVLGETSPRPPRRLGHVVLGTPHFEKATDFYVNGLGFKVSDQVLNGFATFMRVETDHHNLFIHPGFTSHINHYALEVDDVDAIGKAGMAVLADRPDANVVGIGRHNLGANIFWYLTDPSGNMFSSSPTWTKLPTTKTGSATTASATGKVPMAQLVSRCGGQKSLKVLLTNPTCSKLRLPAKHADSFRSCYGPRNSWSPRHSSRI